MITAENGFVPIGGSVDEEVFSFKGLSTDSKPIGEYMGKNIANGSSFFELNTQDIKFYDAASQSWV